MRQLHVFRWIILGLIAVVVAGGMAYMLNLRADPQVTEIVQPLPLQQVTANGNDAN